MAKFWAARLCRLTCPRTFLLRHLKSLIYNSYCGMKDVLKIHHYKNVILFMQAGKIK